MIKNYLISALRFLKRNKLFAGINILGLSLALAASFIILLFVINELSYNSCFKNRKQIYRVLNYSPNYKITDDGTPYILSKSIKDDFPQVKYVARVRNMKGFQIKLKDEFIPVGNAVGSDSHIFKIFDIPVSGQQDNILDEPNSIVLSRKQAQTFFPGKDPIGKELVALVDDKEEVFVVKGVFDDIPVNSTFHADCFINSTWLLEQINRKNEFENVETSWQLIFWRTWLLLDENADVATLEEQFRELEKKAYGEEVKYNFSVQGLPDMYLGSQEINSSAPQGSIKNIRIFSAIAILIIIVAAFNYIILSTAVSTGRTKEIGIRKTNGASAQSIRKQLLNESVVLAMLALPIALLLAWLGKPYAEDLFQTKLLIINSNIAIYVVVYVSLTLLIGLASGLYTSSILSKLNVISIFKNPGQAGKRKSRVRFALIVVQLVIFCSFVSSTLIIRSQYKYAIKKDSGYYNKDILFVSIGKSFAISAAFINSIKSYPNVISAGGAVEALPMLNSMPYNIELPQDKSKKVSIELLGVDYDFVKTMGIQLLEGRGFSREFGSEENSYLVNEAAIKALGITEPIGKPIDVGTIIGVVKDFNLHSIHSNIPPLMLVVSDAFVQHVAIHYKPGSLKSLLPLIKTEWGKVAPDQPFNYKTIEEFNKEVYTEEKNLSVIISICAMFSLLISSFGLFGLTLFVMKTQTKEIGIKRVFGSSEKGIVYSFIRKNFVMVVVANILSIPLTIIVMNRWLSNFAYKTNMAWWFFGIAFLVAALVVLATVLYHSFRASRINPVLALKYE
ncbi:MAG TPA: ABC transporter permease [Prolixibacteraceae bacterium]|nr:ABC transporter permease [Prolixibacteraceae bacterium]